MNKKNIPYIITYSLEILLVLLATLFYRQPLLSVLLLMLIMLVPISVIITRYEAQKLIISATLINKEATVDGVVDILFRVDYKGFIPLLNCMLDFTYENLYYPNEINRELTIPAEARKAGTFTLSLHVSKAGMLSVKTKECHVTDYLHLYTLTSDVNINLEIPILPHDITPPSYPKKKTSSNTSNDDPVEIYSLNGEKSLDLKQLREYHTGDRLKDIHWKLSAKTNELMVREYEEIKELYYLMLPIISNDENDILQRTLEVFLAIGKDLLKEQEPYSVAIYNSTNNTFTIKVITDEDELLSALYELYRCPVSDCHKQKSTYINNYNNSDGIIIVENGKVKDKIIV